MSQPAATRGGYAVGIDSIDALHEELEDRLAALQAAAGPSGAGAAAGALADLLEHLQRHFAHEEGLMAGDDFPMASCHAREHASVLDVVTEVLRRLEAGDAGPLERLAPAMAEWFALHAAGMDAALAAHLRRAAAQTA